MDYDFSIDYKQILLMIKSSLVLNDNSIIKVEKSLDNDFNIIIITQEKYNGFSYPKETKISKVELCFLLQTELNLVNVFASNIDIEYNNGKIIANVKTTNVENRER